MVITAHQEAAACDPAEYGLAGIFLKPFSPKALRALVQDRLVMQHQLVVSLQAHGEQAWEHVQSAEQHIVESMELLHPARASSQGSSGKAAGP